MSDFWPLKIGLLRLQISTNWTFYKHIDFKMPSWCMEKIIFASNKTLHLILKPNAFKSGKPKTCRIFDLSRLGCIVSRSQPIGLLHLGTQRKTWSCHNSRHISSRFVVKWHNNWLISRAFRSKEMLRCCKERDEKC
jgi:hypothetical protein